MSKETAMTQVSEVASRIKGMREIMGWSVAEMAEKTEVTEEMYRAYEGGKIDLPFTFIHKCAVAFDIQMTELLEGRTAKLSSYTVTRKGKGQETAKEDGIEIRNLAPNFKEKMSEPYMVRYEYSPELQNRPIHQTTHGGQEFDLVLEGTLKVTLAIQLSVSYTRSKEATLRISVMYLLRSALPVAVTKPLSLMYWSDA